MVIEILSYNTSLLNPVMKLFIFAGFIIAALLFYRCREIYGGVLRDVSTLLCIGAVAGMLAAAFRFQGDFFLQFKWGESIFNLILAIITLAIALLIRARMKEASRLFGASEGDEKP